MRCVVRRGVLIAIIVLVALVPGLVLAAPQWQDNPGLTGLVAYWSLDEMSGTRVDSFSSNDLTDNNTVGYTTGKIGNAASFVSGNAEYLSIADNAEVSTGDVDWSLEMWVNLSNKSAAYVLASKWDGIGSQEWILYYNQGVDRFELTSPTQTVTANALGSPQAGAAYFLYVWHDADANVVGIRVDDEYENTGVWNAPADGSSSFQLGRAISGHLSGWLDEVAFRKRLLTPAEITWRYNGGVGRDYASLNPPEATDTPVPGPTDTPVVSTATPVPQEVSCLVNGGFEAGSSLGWTGIVDVAGAYARTGSYGAQITEIDSASQAVDLPESVGVAVVRFALRAGTASMAYISGGWSGCVAGVSSVVLLPSWGYYQLARAACGAGVDTFDLEFSSVSGSYELDDAAVYCGSEAYLADVEVNVTDPLEVSVVSVDPGAYSGADVALVAVVMLFGGLVFFVGLFMVLVRV